jgi:AcrR family transcriptional regulator
MVTRRALGSSGQPSAAREPDVAERVVTAAFELFAADGYEDTTVEAITARAGVARRTFFRYFRSKEDVIFPDHEQMLAECVEQLATAGDTPPVAAVCRATTLVFGHYIATPERSVERYRLTTQVPALRAREIASVHGYHRAFTKYLRGRLEPAHGDATALHAEVVAGAVISAHNHALREWLRRGGTGPSTAALSDAFEYVTSTFEQEDPAGPAGRGGAPKATTAVVVVVSTDSAPEELAERIRRLQ